MRLDLECDFHESIRKMEKQQERLLLHTLNLHARALAAPELKELPVAIASLNALRKQLNETINVMDKLRVGMNTEE